MRNLTEESFAAVLSQLRKDAGLSQANLSLKCNKDRSFISMLERGKRLPSLETVFDIAKGLEMEASAIVRMVEQKMKEGKLKVTIKLGRPKITPI